MRLGVRSIVAAFVGLGIVGAALACSTPAASKKPSGEDPEFIDDEPDPLPISPEKTDPDSGANVDTRPAKRDGGDGGVVVVDAAPPALCPTLNPGDLQVVELMIASRAGSGDDGEWLEIRNTRDCIVSLKGITIESPRGAAAADQVVITTDDRIPPGGTFVVADAADTTKNHGITGKVYAFGIADVLKNDGDTVRVLSGTTVIDLVTYPRVTNLGTATSLTFPSDCKPANRTDFARWSLSFDSWTTGFKGTPNLPNDDVTCF
jgi:hypothetical protein